MVMPNMENINHVAAAEASKPNAFKMAGELQHKVLQNKARKQRMATAAQQQNARQAQAAYNQAHANAKLENQAFDARKKNAAKAAAAQQATAKKAAAAHAKNVKAGTAAPAQGAAPRTFAMPAGPQGQAAQAHAAASAQAAKVMQQQRNHAHGQAIAMQNQMNRQAAQTQAQHARTLKQQINTAHGQALKMNAAMTPQSPTPAPGKPAQPLTVQPRSGGFKEHQNPAGSPQTRLPKLSDTETAKTGRENNFSVGTKKPSSNTQGLAAMGARLEAGLMQKKMTLPEPRKRV